MLIKLAGKVRSGPADRPADDRVREPPAAADRRTAAEPLRRRTGAARDPGRVRLLRRPEHADAVERHARGDADLEPRNRLGTRRRRVPERALRPRRSRPAPSNNQAGASSAFTLTLSRQDGEQRFGAFTVKLPAGLSGILGGVALCPEPQASAGRLPAGRGDRHGDGRRRSRLRPLLPARARPAGEQDLPDGSALRVGRAVRVEHRRAGARRSRSTSARSSCARASRSIRVPPS